MKSLLLSLALFWTWIEVMATIEAGEGLRKDENEQSEKAGNEKDDDDDDDEDARKRRGGRRRQTSEGINTQTSTCG